jgi:putative photosynthetic complex assembly protein
MKSSALQAIDREQQFDREHDAEHSHAVPKAPLYAAICLALATLALVTVARLTGYEPTDEPAQELIARDLRFEDRPGGAVAVYEGATNELVEIVPGGGADSFVRSTLRSLARERRREGIGSEASFHLAQHADGRLTLADPVTGRRLDLIAFGRDNANAFARWLHASGPVSSVKVSTSTNVRKD